VKFADIKKKELKLFRTYIVSRATGSTSLRETFSSSSIFWTSPIVDMKVHKNKKNAGHPQAQEEFRSVANVPEVMTQSTSRVSASFKKKSEREASSFLSKQGITATW